MSELESLDSGLLKETTVKIKNIDGRRKFLLITVWATSIFGLLNYWSEYSFFSTIKAFEEGDWTAGENIDQIAAWYGISSLLLILLFILAAIAVPMWFYRAHENLNILKKKLKYTSGWAAGWFFVPFANLYHPFHVMKEIHNGTRIAYGDENRKLINLSASGLIYGWWIIYLFSGFFSNISARMIDEDSIGSYGNNYDTSLLLSLIATVFLIFSAFFLTKLVQEVTNKQEGLRKGEKEFIPISERTEN